MSEIIPRLNGRIILILGNHDRKGSQIYKDFEHVVRGFYSLEYLGTDGVLSIIESKDELFSALKLPMTINGLPRKVIFSHYPITKTEEEWTKRTRNPNNVIQPRIEKLIKFGNFFNITDNIHGHTHSRIVVPHKNESFLFHNASWENIDFKPISIKDLVLKNE